ncbi:hypothetical protein [Pseudonocardia sp.]|uniref:hypothetical protein n=1 Tax=Pseudonocardia sp. TaxID=60912 RepID=UPI003D11F71B
MADRHVLVACMLVAFLVTFLATRLVTRAIRAGRGPFRDTTVGGVHVHHQVYGIFLLLLTGTAAFTYRPESPWVEVLAVLFGVGAALTLDEFALWLHLEDVYWSAEGRTSVDAVMLATVIGALLLIGANPFDEFDADGEATVAVSVLLNAAFVGVALLKGRVVLAVVGMFVPLVAFVAALRLARPRSRWARRYDPEKLARSHARFPAARETRLDRLVDLFALPPEPADRDPFSPEPAAGGLVTREPGGSRRSG